jgi:hypothetical protein
MNIDPEINFPCNLIIDFAGKLLASQGLTWTDFLTDVTSKMTVFVLLESK